MLRSLGDLLAIEETVGIETREEQGGFSPQWTIRTAEAIRVIREERRKVRREKDTEAEAERKARLREAGLID
jgi:hypothetical protein